MTTVLNKQRRQESMDDFEWEEQEKAATLVWEKIRSSMSKKSMYRAKVPGGWIVREAYGSLKSGIALAMVFVPDPKHKWI